MDYMHLEVGKDYLLSRYNDWWLHPRQCERVTLVDSRDWEATNVSARHMFEDGTVGVLEAQLMPLRRFAVVRGHDDKILKLVTRKFIKGEWSQLSRALVPAASNGVHSQRAKYSWVQLEQVLESLGKEAYRVRPYEMDSTVPLVTVELDLLEELIDRETRAKVKQALYGARLEEEQQWSRNHPSARPSSTVRARRGRTLD